MGQWSGRHSFGVRLSEELLSPTLRNRAKAFTSAMAPEYDCFGAHPSWIAVALAITRPFYEGYFRVDSRGAERIPAAGPVIVAGNHSGVLPFDAFMLHADILRNTNPPRMPRTVADHFVPRLPFFSTLVARGGAISGTRRNVEYVLESGQLLVVFPEGTIGIGKPFSRRYQLQTWREGHAELALRYRAPVVPAAIVGAEEQMPLMFRIDRLRLFGAPYFPVPASPFPLPVRYYIRYGAPLSLHDDLRATDDPRDPAVIGRGAERVKHAVQALIDSTLEERKGIFR